MFAGAGGRDAKRRESTGIEEGGTLLPPAFRFFVSELREGAIRYSYQNDRNARGYRVGACQILSCQLFGLRLA